MSITVTLNGKQTHLENVQTVADLLRWRGLTPSLVAVEHNGTIVPREAFDSWQIAEGDRLEVVQFVGGG